MPRFSPHNEPSAEKTETLKVEEIEALDALFEHAGLVRSLRGNVAGITRRARLNRVRMERGEPEDYSRPAEVPQVASNGVSWLPVPAWNAFPFLWHGFSTRCGGGSHVYCPDGAPGELNLGFTASDGRETVLNNRRLFAEAVTGSPTTPLISLRQIHSTLLFKASLEDGQCTVSEGGIPGDRSLLPGCKGDGLMTDEPGVLLGIQTADCIPVLVADRKRRAVAAFHAGWRGTVNRIVENGIGRMRLEFGSQPEDLIAAIGPGIGLCCYSVGEEVLSGFESQFSYSRELFREVYSADAVRTKYPMLFLTQRAPGHSPIGPSMHLDLVEANRRQLLAAGVKAEAIELVGGCTNCHPELFFSHRASQGHAGRMMSVIGIRTEAQKCSQSQTETGF